MSDKIEKAAEGFVAQNVAAIISGVVAFAFGVCFGLLF